VQTVAPSAFVYEPMKHCSQMPPASALADPIGQREHDDAPADEDDPAGHCTHADESVEGACPAGQVIRVRTERRRKDVNDINGIYWEAFGCKQRKD
jgi:hypothetical protein